MTAVVVSALSSTANAAQFRAGGSLGLFYPGFGEGTLSLSVQAPANSSGTLQLRGVLSGGVIGGFGPVEPFLRVDTDLLNTSDGFYFGGGLGSGLSFEGDIYTLLSPLVLANAHLIVGKDFGSYSLEGIARLGFISGVGVRASFPLR